MRSAHFDQLIQATFARKLTAILALSALVAFNVGPLEAKAVVTGPVSCSGGGSFTVSDSGGEIVAEDSSPTRCAGTAVIPYGVTRIGYFENNQTLLRVEIPASVTSIRDYGFAQAGNLAEVVFEANSSLTRIQERTFLNTALTSFTVPANVTSIDTEAFAGDSRLTSLTFESGSRLQSIGGYAFARTGLTSVSVPDSVLTIGGYAFHRSASLTSVSFGANSLLTGISGSAFEGTALTSLAVGSLVQSFSLTSVPQSTSITIASDNPYLAIRDGVLFNSGITRLLAYPKSATASSYIIPSSVTEIAGGAFSESLLGVITIPESVSTMGTYTFARSERLTEVIFSGTPTLTEIPEAAFQSSTLATIEIPASVTSIGYYALSNTPQLTNLTFASGSKLRHLGQRSLGSRNISFTLPTPLRSGYLFTGWASSENGTPFENPEAAVLVDWELFALWTPVMYSAEFNSNLGTSVDSVEFQSGGSLEAPADPTREGFTFAGWSATQSGSAVVFPYSPGVQSGITLYALWTENAPEEPTITEGSIPNSQVATIPVGLTAAELPATAALPRVTLNFAATSESATATVAPIDNPADASVTPFAITGTTKIVDIQVSGITGPVTVCLDGASTDDIFHFTGGAWVSLPNRTYVNGQVCGVTMNFSPFAAAALSPAPASTLPRPVAALPVPMFEMGSRLAVLDKGQRLTLQGKNLNEIDSIRVGGKEAKIIEKAAGEVVIDVPASAEGFPEVVVLHKNGTVSIQGWMQVVAPYALTRSIKITRFVGDRPTLAGIAALERTFLAGPTANIVTCIMTVAVDASAAEVARAEMRSRKTCQRVVKLSARFKTADVRVSRSGEPGSKPVLLVTFDRTLSGS